MASKKNNFLNLLNLLCLLFPCCIIATDTISSNQSIEDGMVLVSDGGVFALGFFSPGKSTRRYVGIWYHSPVQQRVVWVANRENPIEDTAGKLVVKHGNLFIFNGNEEVPIWSTNVSTTANSSFAKLLDSGNLVLSQEDEFQNHKEVVWESFDYPTHIWLPGMKLGVDKETGLDRGLVSWKSLDDPAPGDFVLRFDLRVLPQVYAFKRSKPYWRSGPWSHQGLTGVPDLPKSPLNFTFVNNQHEIYLLYSPSNTSVLHYYVLDEVGLLQRFTWLNRNHQWNMFWSVPRDQCDAYNECGSYGNCNSNDALSCSCLPGFKPQYPQEWTLRDGSAGCLRKRAIECGKNEGFLKLQHVKIPDTLIAQVSQGLSLKECEQTCSRNCSCTAYAVSDLNKFGTSCVVWYEDLHDTRQFVDGGDDLYVRVDAIELENARKNTGGFGGDKKMQIVVLVPVSLAVLLGIFICIIVRSKRAKARVNEEKLCELLVLNDFLSQNHLQEVAERKELPFFNLDVVEAATDNFSDTNKLGAGGFGQVYKGRLSNGHDVAVKRQSKDSGQGIEEFKNEVLLMTKLQHRNLVRLLGCCIQGEEKMLIYEYMPNNSLDSFIFDETRKASLDWKRRYGIIVGIARGILYLHQDSRFRIIHRDLKASNVLLDAEMNPKISDFGAARIFGGNQTQLNTKRVVGTYGYMSPEYATTGQFSEKSDVYSFGVLLLEIISGKRNSGYYHEDPTSNVTGYAYDMWREGTALELVHPSMEESYCVDEVIRCIQVGLLCVQGMAKDRPTMASVVFMLGTDIALPPPRPPAYVIINYPQISSPAHVTTTIVEPR